MKKCITCLIDKNENEFAFKNKAIGIRHNTCKKCHKVLSKKHYLNNKSKYLAKSHKHRDELYKYCREIKQSTPCADCKEMFPYYVMDFDHLRDKEFNISRITCGFEKLKEEISKCEIVCANCHRERTYRRKYGRQN